MWSQAGELMRYWWTRECLATPAGRKEWLSTMTRAILAAVDKPNRQGIKPVRVHSSGDFFNRTYFDAWMDLVDLVGDLDPKVRFWAPTRCWAIPNFDWDRLGSMKHQNLVVRPSAYHVGDAAPGRLHPSNAYGTTAIYNDDNLGMAPVREGLILEVRRVQYEEHRAAHGTQARDERYDWDCVGRGSLIPIKGRGYIPVEEVVSVVASGSKVETLTRVGWRRVVDAKCKGRRETVLVQLRSGQRLRVTPDHRLAVSDTDWLEARQVDVGGVVCLGPEDGAAAVLGDSVEEYEAGVLLGYVVGDGHFGVRNTIQIQVGSSKAEDLAALDRIATRMFGRGGSFSEHVRENSGSEVVPYGKSLTVRLTLTGQEFADFFRQHGYEHGSKSPIRRAPANIFTSSRTKCLGFLSGIFSADGSVVVDSNDRAAIQLAGTSLGLLADVQQMLSMLGSRSTICKPKNRPPHHPLHTLTVKSAAGVAILREARLLSRAKREAIASAVLPEKRRHRDSNLLSIIRDGVEMDVYDIEVETDHEFIANGVVVHNCQTYATKLIEETGKEGALSASCDDAVAPDGKQGCRACWISKNLRVNYTAH
jgi:hypothetical protein